MATIQSSIEPGGSILVTVSYDAADNAPGVLPDTIRVVVDEANQERECNEANNELTTPVNGGMQEADLRVTLGAVDANKCPIPEVLTTVFNDGSAPASNFIVRYYAGDPNQGGFALHDEPVAGPIAAGGMLSFTAKLANFPKNSDILVYAIVDADNVVPECNDGNNKASAPMKIDCVQLN
jgi:hypothetical protein